MAFVFPEDKADFTAPNGVTYAWDGNKWRTKKYALNDEKLAEYLTKNNPRATGALTVSPVDWMEQSRFCVTNGSSAYFILKPSSTPERSQIQYWGMTEGDRDLATVGYVKNQLTVGGEEIDFGKFVKQDEFDSDQAAQDQLIAENRRSIEELEVTKGPVSRYECKGTSFNVASRNGDLYVNDATAANVTAISFAPFDLNGNPTRPVGTGDIIEFVESANLKSVGQVSRFRVDSGDDPTALTVTYLNGENNFEVGETEEVYIYPQNEETASKEYVDSNFLPLAGGELTGPLRIKRGDEKTHPQWKISPNGGSDYATNIYSLEGPMRIRTSHTGDEGEHKGSHIVLDPDVAGGGADQTTKIYKVPLPNQPDMAASKAYVDQEVAAGGGTDYTLPTASTGIKGGVKAGTTGGTYVSCTKMSGEVMGVVQSSSTVRGVNYKGQACITADSTPNAANFQQGAMIFSTSTNSLYVRT